MGNLCRGGAGRNRGRNRIVWKQKMEGELIMGLIKARMGALGGTMAIQWKEFFYCDAIDKDVLVVKGQK